MVVSAQENATQEAFERTQISDTMVEMLHDGNERERLQFDTIRKSAVLTK
jgi:hypothetical protein